ncbi:7-methyl-GTP pyrophosphatase-like isoform X1 [Lolium rigidum]|uniref:7-methyl-GTP pyrophosphatase-like isoform X1 n=1 Tax=Lolium rigidum TaxID=89674 RepID=UPI001F5E0BED|nr:7-methyl-GTP pyrophosphatase-like isoform X1 [Lolium rigidum]XP_047069384.1 7-methyl-GTP pyrophosphatase-like isoform X1 [Lolium rigidum]XP_047091080.1 7-methyl-GTP pyrophosphatase-like isoform X1 [Lolium rigidum]XP_047091081.1 7-methyl-GTP pyrophosphatase-like isoform X1 [Lolium rigidum]
MQSSHRPCNLLCPVAPSATTAPLPHQRPPHLLGTPPQRLLSPPSRLTQTRLLCCKTAMSTSSSSAAAAAGNPQPFKLILGSSSVARKNILNEMGFEFQVMTADIDERSIRREDPEELVMVLAEAKADAIMSRMRISDYQKEGDQPTLLITSDIVVVHEGIIREKPSTKEEARQFLKGYSGGHVSTVGGVVVTNLTTGKKLGSLDKAEVYFHDIPEEVIEKLIDEGVVFRVAGGLLLEHPLTLPFVEAVVGSSDSVMGLSKDVANKLIHEALTV